MIVMLNFVLKSILQRLVEWEKHWTQSDKVRPPSRAHQLSNGASHHKLVYQCHVQVGSIDTLPAGLLC